MSIEFCHKISLAYAGCVPVARLAAAQAALRHCVKKADKAAQAKPAKLRAGKG